MLCAFIWANIFISLGWVWLFLARFLGGLVFAVGYWFSALLVMVSVGSVVSLLVGFFWCAVRLCCVAGLCFLFSCCFCSFLLGCCSERPSYIVDCLLEGSMKRYQLL